MPNRYLPSPWGRQHQPQSMAVAACPIAKSYFFLWPNSALLGGSPASCFGKRPVLPFHLSHNGAGIRAARCNPFRLASAVAATRIDTVHRGILATLTTLITMKRSLLGFTLIELLCVMAVIAILSSIALPNYHHTQRKGQRTLAKLALAKTAHWLERSASDSGAYPLSVPDSVWQSPELRYRLQVQSQAQSFILTATPLGSQAQDACGTLSLSHTGEQGVQNATQSAAQCWAK